MSYLKNNAMKIIFDYIYRDTCYGEARVENERRVEAEIKDFAEIQLSPCDKKVKATVNGYTVLLQFANGRQITAAFEKTPFGYEESYELFDDVRYKELSGTVRLEK